MRKSHAYTLIELVIAFIIFSGLLTIVYNVIIQTRLVNKHVDKMGEELLEPYLALKMFYEDCERYTSCPGWAKDRRAFELKNHGLLKSRLVFWARLSRPKHFRGIHLIEYDVSQGKMTRKVYLHEKGSSLDISNYTTTSPADTTEYLSGLYSIYIRFRTGVDARSPIWQSTPEQPEPPFVNIMVRKGAFSVKYNWIVPFGPAN